MHQPIDPTNPNDPHVIAALTLECQCGAPPGHHCKNTLQPGKTLPGGRLVHYNRAPIGEQTPAK